jgi:hypothetical protein
MISLKKILSEATLKEASMPPVRKVVNAILKKHSIVPMKTSATSVKGFHNIDRGGYRYEGNYFLGFYGVPQDIIDKVGAEMKKAGVKDVDVRKGTISADFTINGLKESVNEGLYFVGYNKGRGQGTGVFKDSYSSYKDAKKAVEKLEKERGGSYNMVAYYVSDKDGKFVKESVTEAKAPYEVYHKSYTSAIEAAREYAEKKGFEIDNDDSFRKIGMGPRKPSEGKTNSFSIQLTKDGKLQRKQLHIQVYGMKNSYELNAYIG